MLPITGYVDRWSVRPGEEINFMIGVRGGGLCVPKTLSVLMT
jgi:N,N-dimethylformamidase